MILARELIEKAAAEQGLHLVASLSLFQFSTQMQIDSSRLRVWQEKEYAGGMQFMKRSPELFSELNNFLPGAESILSFVISYNDSEESRCARNHGRIARYAWGEDYHRVISERLIELGEKLKARSDLSLRYRVFSDAVPLLERSIAKAAGLGFIGKNSLLIRPGTGSFTFLGEILLSAEVESIPTSRNIQHNKSAGCKTCFRCASACPTDAIVAPYEIDARRCISYLTIEKRTEFNDWEERAIGEWLFGCDLCQDICPFNHGDVERTEIREFRLKQRKSVDLAILLRIRNDQEYKRVFNGSAILRAKRAQLLRNATAVIANKSLHEYEELLLESIREDPSELVRNSARRALFRMGGVTI